MRLRYIILVNLFVIALATIIVLVAWNTPEQPRSLFFNLATELLGAVIIFILLNLLFPINSEKFILERISTALDRLETKAPIFLNRTAARDRFNFSSILSNARQLDILAYSSGNLVENHWAEITNAVLLKGTQVRILVVNPESEASKLIQCHSSGKAFEGDVLKTQARCKNLEKELVDTSKGRKKVHLK